MPRSRDAAIAVTGLHTFAGREVLRRLVDAGRRVVGIDLDRPEDLPESVAYYKVDLTIPTADAMLADIFRREGVDSLVHLAFLETPSRNTAWAHELQVIGTLHLLHACAAQNIERIIVRSSMMVYGANALNPNYLTEEAPLKGVSGYRWVQDMVEIEHLLDRFRRKHPKARVTSLRMAPVLGPTVQNIVTRSWGRTAVPTLLGYDPLWQLLHEEDALSAITTAIEADVGGAFNIVGKGVLPLSSLLYLAGRINIPIAHPVAYPLVAAAWMAGLSPVPAEHLDFLRFLWLGDGAKAERELGFVPSYGVRDTIEQFAGALRLRDAHLAA
jgi:UDP-glucose 4-epimerase